MALLDPTAPVRALCKYIVAEAKTILVDLPEAREEAISVIMQVSEIIGGLISDGSTATTLIRMKGFLMDMIRCVGLNVEMAA